MKLITSREVRKGGESEEGREERGREGEEREGGREERK